MKNREMGGKKMKWKDVRELIIEDGNRGRNKEIIIRHLDESTFFDNIDGFTDPELISNREVRENKLTGEEDINSNLLVYNYIGHRGVGFLKGYNNLEELEEEILCGAYLCNTFCTQLTVIENGKIKEYEYSEEENTVRWL